MTCNELNKLSSPRIPIPEGLAPLDAASLDLHLTQAINQYTLRGYPILVHCRGGVGRAGIVACCWMLKLGLCGWFDCRSQPALKTGPVGEEKLHLVKRAISIVRKRRSPKAIETYEQVKFLVEYVDYLRERAIALDVPECSDIMDFFADWDANVI